MCQGLTLKNTKCKRKVEPYCKDHIPVISIKGFPLDISKCTTKITKRLTNTIKKGPSKSDGEGHIYVYYIEQDEKDTYYKIGRTKRSVDKRLAEWKGAIKKISWKVKYQKLAEKLIHTYLDHVRVYRYELEENKQLCTIWKTTGKPVQSSDKELKDKYKLEARTKMIEWFKITYGELKDIIENILKIDLLK